MIRLGAICYTRLPEAETLVLRLGIPAAEAVAAGRRGKARSETLLGFYLLAQMLPNADLSQIARAGNGRPYLVGRPEADFNFSHAKGAVVCAVELTESGDAPRVGVDAERLFGRSREEMERIVKRWFTPAEQARWQADPTELTFLSVWTAKEAVAKRAGGGIRDLRQIDTESLDRVAVASYRLGCAVVSLAHGLGRAAPREIERFGMPE